MIYEKTSDVSVVASALADLSNLQYSSIVNWPLSKKLSDIKELDAYERTVGLADYLETALQIELPVDVQDYWVTIADVINTVKLYRK